MSDGDVPGDGVNPTATVEAAAAEERGSGAALHLWEAVGVEIEYMIVDRTTLDVRPVADQLIAMMSGEEGAADFEDGNIAVSNELALHVVEMKTNGPAPGFAGLASAFQREADEINRALAHLDALLLPGGMHPWMRPDVEFEIWPHEYNDVYRAFDRIFGCDGHGWANLQSTHVNLPFDGDEEFYQLHEAVRLVLPLIPALAASSPIIEAHRRGTLDSRVAVYRDNALRVPSVTGGVIPERLRTTGEFERTVLARIYEDMAPLDPDGTLKHEWVNARGAIVRQERGAIEIRLIDAQECPLADVAVAAAVSGAVRWLAEGPLAADPDAGAGVGPWALREALADAVDVGEKAYIRTESYLALFGMENVKRATTRDVWKRLHATGALVPQDAPELSVPIRTILEHGPLARRILAALDAKGWSGEGEPSKLRDVYERLADCVADGEVFTP
jgi:glutamate---cysteine ligase / carboxylate-amine ligase